MTGDVFARGHTHGNGRETLITAARWRDPRLIAFVANAVVLADWLFTATTRMLQPLSSAWLVPTSGLPWSSHWLRGSLVLFAIAALCWFWVVYLQLRMRSLARAAEDSGTALPPLFQHSPALECAGVRRTVLFLGIFYLMVLRPA